MTDQIRIGIIGGSGLYAMDTLTDVYEQEMDTPFGAPSGPITIGTLASEKVAFIARHGQGHVLNPTEVPYRANIYALKMLGVEYIVAVSACGSLREELAPGHFVIPDQLIDFTKGKRDATFFENGLVAHTGVANPFCGQIRPLIQDALQTAGATVHMDGNFITIEGPRFSTKGESHLYRQWGMDIIGMTTSPEAFLAREAEICYAVMAAVTDYDVWHEVEVTAADVMSTFAQNVQLAQQAIINVIPKIAQLSEPAAAHTALTGALTTQQDMVDPDQYNKLKLIIEK